MATVKRANAKKKTAAKKKTPAKKSGDGEQLSLQGVSETKSAGLSVGDPAPGFELPGDDGRSHGTASLAGQRFVLYFYPRDNTSGCTTEAKEFSELAGFDRLGVPVLGVSPDSLASHEKFRAKHGLTVKLLADEDRQVASAYGAYGEKKMYGRVVMGIIRSTFVIGADGRIEHMWQPVRKAAGHAAAVLAAIEG